MKSLAIVLSSLLIASSCIYGQNSIKRTDMFPEQYLSEAYKGHEELIKGSIGETLRKFVEDSLHGVENDQNILLALTSEEYRFHSARIDTHYYTVGPNYGKMELHVSFRDIFYLGNNQFRRYLTNFSFTCDVKDKSLLYARQVAIVPRVIDSQCAWRRSDWYKHVDD